MALHKNDTVAVTGQAHALYHVTGFSPENPVDLWLKPLSDGRKEAETLRLRSKAALGALGGVVNVNVLGAMS